MRCTMAAHNLLVLISFSFFSSSIYAQRPNIIYIMSDDMGYGDLGSYGRKDYATPHLDKLASQGIRFTNAYAAAPLCTPTRAALMTGRYPAKTPVGLIEPLTGSGKDTAYGLTTEYPSMASLLKASGYKTAMIGKWHLGALKQHSPILNGFDYFYGIRSGAADYISHVGTGHHHDLYENDSLVYHAGYLTEMFTQMAIGFINQKHESPFFLALTYNAPHWPWQGPSDKAYADTSNFRNGGSAAVYAIMMKSLDDGIGAVLKALDDAGLSEETMVIFTNDNGGERYSDNGGFKNSKATLWEGGIRVPAFVRWTGKIKSGVTTEQVAITMDWTATILATASVSANKDFPLDGISLLPVLLGKQPAIGRTLFWRTYQRNKQQAIRKGRWKYLRDEKAEYLFDLINDPSESKNLYLTRQAVFKDMKNLYIQWEKTLLKPVDL